MCGICNASEWYVRPITGEYGAEDGTSYATAYDGFAGITWGVGGVVAGDTMYVCGTFREQLNTGASGGVGSYITIKKHDDYDAVIIGSLDYDSADEWGVSNYDPVGATTVIWETDDTFTDDVGQLYYDTNATIAAGNKETASGDLDADWDFFYDGVADDKVHVYYDNGGAKPSAGADGLELTDPTDVSTTGRITVDEDYIIVDGITVKYTNTSGVMVYRASYVEVKNCIISYTGGRLSTARIGNGIQAVESDNVTIDGNTCFEGLDVGIAAESNNDGFDTHDITINNNLCYNQGCSGISVYNFNPTNDTTEVYDVIITANTVYDTGKGWIGQGPNCTTETYGIRAYSDDPDDQYNITVNGNVVYGVDNGDGISFKETDGTITQNVVYNNEQNGIELSFPASAHDSDVEISYNLVYGNEDHGILLDRNTGVQNIYNNTVDCNGLYASHAALRIDQDTDNITVTNNILYSNTGNSNGGTRVLSVSGSVTGEPTLNYNLYYSNQTTMIMYSPQAGADDYALADFGTYKTDKSQDANSVASDPLFVSTEGNFRLRAGSPARDAGTDVGLTEDIIGSIVPQNTIPDIGAYEYPTLYNELMKKMKAIFTGIGIQL